MGIFLQSNEENTFLHNYANRQKFWTGGFYASGEWQWLDKSVFSFANWDSDQPNDNPLADSPVAGSWKGGNNLKWHDDKAAHQAQFICKKKPG